MEFDLSIPHLIVTNPAPMFGDFFNYIHKMCSYNGQYVSGGDGIKTYNVFQFKAHEFVIDITNKIITIKNIYTRKEEWRLVFTKQELLSADKLLSMMEWLKEWFVDYNNRPIEMPEDYWVNKKTKYRKIILEVLRWIPIISLIMFNIDLIKHRFTDLFMEKPFNYSISKLLFMALSFSFFLTYLITGFKG